MADQNPQSPEEAPGTAATVRRRWLMRWPLLIPLVFIGGLLWISMWFSRRSQLLDEAGSVVFDAPTWNWLERLGGQEMRTLFASPTELSVSGERPTASQMQMIGSFSELKHLSFRGGTDADLRALRRLNRLEWLSLHHASISDAGCEALTRIPNLTTLMIWTDQTLSADGLAHIGTLGQLTQLHLDSPGLSDAALDPLCNLTRLQRLSVHDADITGDRLNQISRLSGLSFLSLTGCRITPGALSSLQGLPNALSLYLDGSTITDEHFDSLDSVSWLISVSCTNTGVTRAGCEEFAKSRPGVTVIDALGEKIVVEPVYGKPSAEAEADQ